MADTKFYKNRGPFSLAELAEIGQCQLSSGSKELQITDVAPMTEAISGTIGVFHNMKYKDALKSSQASACVVDPENAIHVPDSMAKLISSSPYRSYALIASAFYPDVLGQSNDNEESEIHPTAIVDKTATLGKACKVGPYAVIGKNVKLGNGVQVDSHTSIGDNCEVGNNVVIDSHVSIQFSIIGNNVHIKPGARIGQSGFGFFMDEKGHVPVPQLGRVIIQDYVEIGSNTTVDRGSGQDTVIGLGTRIDNLVQVAHNVQFGKGCVMVAQSGVSGSTKFGDYVACGGQVGIIDHLKIGTGARLAAQCGIMSDVEPGAILCGSPAVPIKSFYRQVATLQKLSKTGKGRE